MLHHWIRPLLSITLFSALLTPAAFAADKSPACLDGKSAGPDFALQGEYVGRGADGAIGAQVIALGNSEFDAVIYHGGLPGAGWDGKAPTKIHGKTVDAATEFSSDKGKGIIKDQRFSGDLGGQFELRKVERQSPTMGAKPPEGAIVLFDGKNVDAWDNAAIEQGDLLGVTKGVGPRTKQKFSSYTLHIEFRSPYMPAARGQGRGNSGVYLNDQYECQVLDSFGLSGENNECGGFYQIAKPLVNMCLPPLSWQTYDIEFTAAKYEGDKKVADAVAHVKHNGVVIHDHLKLPKFTPGGGQADESKPGSFFLQNHGNPVHYRNIWVVEKK
ncbi:MAG: DUF1080 domain-containing protein [Planctomycetales bacterium]